MLLTDVRMAISIGLSAGLIITLGLPDSIYGPLGAEKMNFWRQNRDYLMMNLPNICW
jgi:hypothetical protein